MGDETDPLLRVIKKYSKYPKIKQYFKNPTKFSFVPVDKDVIVKKIKNWDTKKAAPQDDIRVKILKLNNDIFSVSFLMKVLKWLISKRIKICRYHPSL